MPPNVWCDDCAHFVTDPDADEAYNPCTKGHPMRFKSPAEYQWYYNDDWGFYRRQCQDRQERPTP